MLPLCQILVAEFVLHDYFFFIFYLFRSRSLLGERTLLRLQPLLFIRSQNHLPLPQVSYPHPNRNLQPTPSLALITLTLTQATSEINHLKSLPFGLRTGVRCMWVWRDIVQLLINVVCGIFYVFYDILHADIHISACSRRFF